MSDPLTRMHEFYDQHVRKYGTMIAGALFGLGWWFFLDAAIVSQDTVGFSKYIPGLTATLGFLLINGTRFDEIRSVDPWADDEVYCRSRIWLLVGYLVSASAIAIASIIMITTSGSYFGLACILQVTSILGSSLVFFVSRTDGESSGDVGYGGIGLQ